VIKVIWAAHRRPGMSDEDFYRHWGQVHGSLGTRVAKMRRYIQHHTLAEARDGGPPVPTHDGASISWFDDVPSMQESMTSPEWKALSADSPNLFDQSRKMDSVVATERVVVDGTTTPAMVKAIWIAHRNPGLSDEEFFGHWFNIHGTLGAQAPGVRRYVQNHAITDPNAYAFHGGMTHDGWSEMWFDDLQAMRKALASPEWQALSADGPNVFDRSRPMSVVVARERPIIA
jgi:uncharacterized protein (TIGR02118 family)